MTERQKEREFFKSALSFLFLQEWNLYFLSQTWSSHMFYLSLESSRRNPKATASLSVRKHVPTTIMYRLFTGRGGCVLGIAHYLCLQVRYTYFTWKSHKYPNLAKLTEKQLIRIWKLVAEAHIHTSTYSECYNVLYLPLYTAFLVLQATQSTTDCKSVSTRFKSHFNPTFKQCFILYTSNSLSTSYPWLYLSTELFFDTVPVAQEQDRQPHHAAKNHSRSISSDVLPFLKYQTHHVTLC